MFVDKFYMHKVYMRRLETFLTIYVKLSLKLRKLVTLHTAQGGWGGGIRTSALRSRAACPTTRLLPSMNSIIMLSEIL